MYLGIYQKPKIEISFSYTTVNVISWFWLSCYNSFLRFRILVSFFETIIHSFKTKEVDKRIY